MLTSVARQKHGKEYITRDGFHFNPKYWQVLLTNIVCQYYKKGLPPLPKPLFETCIGMILGDAPLFKVSREGGIKFEQGYKQEEFLYDLFDLFSGYTFIRAPGLRIDLHSSRKGLVKSLWFKTFLHPSFTELYTLFDKAKKKEISEN